MGNEELRKYTELMLDERNSMLWWYPKIKDIVFTPRTQMVGVVPKEAWGWLDDGIPGGIVKDVRACAEKIGYPVFIRTDQTSGKHRFEQTCFVSDGKDIGSHLYQLNEESACCGVLGLPVRAFMVREYIHPMAEFKAFQGLPIGHELRVFIRDGEIECFHYYWPEEAIRFWGDTKEPENWKMHLQEMKESCESRGIVEVRRYALKIATVLEGYWSVDFMLGSDDRWYMLDAALGSVSYHIPGCEYCPEDQREG